MAKTICFTVEGYPPAKGEAMSMLGKGHGHAPRVKALLDAAREEASASGFEGLGSRPIELVLVVRCPRDARRSDATNYLGGVADVLEDKGNRGALDHLGTLASVSLYDNDRQIEKVSYRWEDAVESSYEVRLTALDIDERGSTPRAMLEEDKGFDQTPGSYAGDPFTRGRLEVDGFVGWLTFDELRQASLATVPPAGGVYVVIRGSREAPTFLDINPGGRFKRRDPTVATDALTANWVDGAEVVYIGKANSLKRRLGEFERFGSGAPVGHWGGRLIWQLADSMELQVGWRETPSEEPAAVEAALLAEFRAIYGKPPFANDPQLLGR